MRIGTKEMKREREERCNLGRSDELEVGIAGDGKTEESSSDKASVFLKLVL